MAGLHWDQQRDKHQILWLTINRADSSTNSLNDQVLEELAAILDEVKKDPGLKGMVILSGKPNGFIAGADLEAFQHLKDSDEALAVIQRGQAVFNTLAELEIPTIALIQGFCLGGGLELALACRYRVACDDEKTRLGLPEVKLGIHPGWGGTVRLPQLIGIAEAFPLLLTGRALRAKAAARLGLVDYAVPERHLLTAVQTILQKLPRQRRAPWSHAVLSQAWLRPWFGRWVRYQTRKQANSAHYPAPFAIIDRWIEDGAVGPSAFRHEAESISRLMMSDTARQLGRLFFLQERLKKLSKSVDFKAKRLHVIGAGVMGGDIAAWAAMQGLYVTLQDREASIIAPAIARAQTLFEKRLKEPRLIQAAFDRLIPDPEGQGILQADVIIEAIIEDLSAKQALFQELEKKARKDAILASNTSSILLEDIATALSDKARLVGIHFFNPVAKMPLVEVVHHLETDLMVIKQAVAFVRQLDKYPLPVTSSPGFLVNRVLTPYLLEAVNLLNEGVPAEVIDAAAVDFGMPMGPIELADSVGLDICLHVARNLTKHLGGSVPAQLETLVQAKQLGRKTGQGFYRYRDGKPIKKSLKQNHSTVATIQITERLINRFVDEAKACLKAGVVTDPDLLDAGIIFGTGFAPFRGGPLKYAESLSSISTVNVVSEPELERG